jgi:hypothetical protein
MEIVDGSRRPRCVNAVRGHPGDAFVGTHSSSFPFTGTYSLNRFRPSDDVHDGTVIAFH